MNKSLQHHALVILSRYKFNSLRITTFEHFQRSRLFTMTVGDVTSANGDKRGNIEKIPEATDRKDKAISIREGLADILIPSSFREAAEAKKTGKDDNAGQSVFYNPIQQFNRDLSVLAIKIFGQDLQAARRLKIETNKSRGKKRKRKTKDHDSNDSTLSTFSALVEDTKQEFEAENKQPNGSPVLVNEAEAEAEAEGTNDEQHEGAAIGSLDQETEQQKDKIDQNTQHTHRMKFKILDALSATGLRAIRYAKEIPFATTVVANDMSAKAAESIASNLKANNLEKTVTVTCDNAMSHMYAFASPQAEGLPRSGKYDVIDLDPYGTAAPFLDAAMQAINDGGLLCVTCTDAGVWASCGYPEKTYALYGGLPIKGHHSHEGGLRLILHAIASAAARYGMAIEPLMSLSIDFYARVFVRVVRSQAEVKLLSGKTMLVYSCDSGCGAWTIQPLAQNKAFQGKDGQYINKHSLAQGPPCSPFCSHCGTKTHLSGPMYGGPIHNPDFLKAILKDLPHLDPSTYGTIDRIEGMVSTALEETFVLGEDVPDREGEGSAMVARSRLVPRIDPAKIDSFPFFFKPSGLAGVIHCRPPSESAVKGALKHAGYGVSKSHAKRDSIKTNAPWSFIWDMMRQWEREEAPIKEGALKPGQPGWRILNKHAPDGTASSSSQEVSAPDRDKIEYGKEDKAQVRINFDEELGRNPNRKRMLRYQVNPRANWGPMHRASGKH